MDKLKFGDRVRFTAVLTRKNEMRPTETPSGREYSAIWKVWSPTKGNGEGLFLGYRTLKNGLRHYDSDEGWSFEQKEHFKAALVCPSPHENPIYVPLGHCSQPTTHAARQKQ